MAWFRILLLFLPMLAKGIGSKVPTTNGTEEIDRRLFVTKNLLDKDNTPVAFYTSDGTLLYSNVTSPNLPLVRSWVDLGAPMGLKVVSNPVGLHSSENQIQLFAQASDGQVYTMQQLPGTKAFNFGNWTRISTSKLAFEEGATLNGLDSVSVGIYKNQIVVFARTISHKSTLFWCKGIKKKFLRWERIGDATPYLFSDATPIYNPFSGYFEAFAVMSDGFVHRTWQRNDEVWAGWRVMGDWAPKQTKTSRPVAIVMSQNFFNGFLQVFALGADGVVKQIWQTTCDKVDDLWGWCTWGLWYDLSSKMPPTEGANVIAPGTNTHHGGELFAVDTSGVLWYSWQSQRGAGWIAWDKVPRANPTQPIVTKPYVTSEDKLWWTVFGLGKDGHVAVIEQYRSLTVEPGRVASGASLTASWSVPLDEATNMDWIGIYPAGTNNDQYVDFVYVQGEQNPKSSAVHEGSVKMASLLPNGRYDVRYLVNRQFVSVLNKSVEYYNGSHEEAWVQVYRGIFLGLGSKNTNFKECVEDGNKTVAAFRKSFKAFEEGQLYKGLQLFGTALIDVKDTLIACLKTDIVKALEKFIKDLLSCTEGNCVKFVIDTLDVLLILFNNIYEIFGDIHSASNAFGLIEGYEQGGLCIGRVVKACISLP
ncbi:uncharacterized protein LOC117294846 [Asterias rubens]|uniref:uncharacterized protein LOC117294846 n=1 Tax=Asterias rubens TaxID=7604 RepID=UPI0014550A38|nr:uncharacterized protein LOC117294846 [Asterias rubens]